METIGTYTLLRKLAHGGMAEIFLAARTGEDTGTPVVIKCILPELANDPRFVAMFLNEAQLAAHMHHPGIVQVMAFGEENGRLYMVMEFVDGLDCWRFARRSESWGADHAGVAVYIIRQVLDALSFAHNMRDVNGDRLMVVHRDLSPSNIYLSRSGQVKLGDFGIARVESTRFRPVQVIPRGKFGYMAPEQVEGQPVDMRADIYSAGVVLSELLIREQLFSGTSQLSVMLDIRDGRLEKLERHAGKIPEGLRQVLEGALARDPADRYRTAAEFSQALEAFEVAMAHPIGQEEFAALVEKAMDEGGRQGNTTSDISAIAKNMAGGEVLGMQLTHPDGITNVDALRRAKEQGTPITMDFEQQTGQGRYWARLPDQPAVGPTSFAHIVELIYSDRIGEDTFVSRDGVNFEPAGAFPELVRHLPVYTPATEDTDVTPPKRRGVLDIEPPCQVLLTIAASGDTGALVCDSSGRRKEIYLREGIAVYVGSNEPGELLGEYLVEHRILERSELEMALALLPKFHGHLGDTLIALGMLTAVELLQHINGQISERLDDLITWQNGNYEFYEDVEVRKGVLEVQIDPIRFVREFLESRLSTISGDRIFAELSPYQVAPTPLRDRLIDRLHLSEPRNGIIRGLTGWTRVSELIFLTPTVPQEVGKSLFVAVESGLWTCDGPSIPWHESHYDL